MLADDWKARSCLVTGLEKALSKRPSVSMARSTTSPFPQCHHTRVRARCALERWSWYMA